MAHSFDIYNDLVINATPKEVFDALTLPKHLNNWWTLKCTGKPEVGEQYNLYFAPEYDWLAEVVTCNIGTSFHLKMIRSDEDWSPTTFGFDLEPSKNGTTLKHWHKNWPRCNDHFRQSSYCWSLLLSGLKQYVEKGVIIPFKERA